MHTSGIELTRFADFQPTAFDAKGLGSTDTPDWLVAPCIVTRDSRLLDSSNWDAQLDRIERASHRTRKFRQAALRHLRSIDPDTRLRDLAIDERWFGACDLPINDNATVGDTVADLVLDSDDYEQHTFGHWGPGHFSILIVRPGSAAHREAQAITASLADYPVLDESNYSNREYEATIDNIEIGLNMAESRYDIEIEDYRATAVNVFSHLWETDQSALESRDDQGGDPSAEAIDAALEALGYLESEIDSDE